MSAYDELNDLYNFDEEVIEISIEFREKITIDDEIYKGYMCYSKGKKYFIHRLKSVDGSNRTMGNLWSVYSIDDNMVLRSGCKTKNQAIEEIKYI